MLPERVTVNVNGVLPVLPWRASFGRTTGPAPELGADSDHVLANVLGLTSERIVELKAIGALGFADFKLRYYPKR